MIYSLRLIFFIFLTSSIYNTSSARDGLMQTAANTHQAQSTIDSSGNPSTPLAKAVPPEGFKELRGIIIMAIQPGGMFGMTSDVIALLNDGSYTSDLKTLFAKGRSASMKNKPSRWGKWKISGDDLLLKEYKSKEFSETRGDWIARPAPSDLKLNGCYGNITAASDTPYGGKHTVGNASSWCFKPDGRFAHSSTGFATASGGVSGGTFSKRKQGGRYRIDNYTAKFVYDDGTELVTAFCFLSEDKSHIAINGKRYMGRN
jgi:hypothetical protein